MRNARYALTLLAMFLSTPATAKIATVAEVFPNCSNPSDDPGHTLTVDPINNRSGYYSSIDAALQVAKPGDTIALMTGNYGNLNISGRNQGGFITIAAGNGQSPIFTIIFVGGYKPASHWGLTGLTISGFVQNADKRAQTSLVMVSNSDNIILDGNDLRSQDGVIDWKSQVPAASAPASLPPYGISARQSSCISIVNNHLRNVLNGMDFGGDQVGNNGKYFLVSGNSIDNFAGDGIDHYASHVRSEKNRITNGHDICNNTCVHSAGIQGWNYNHLPVVNSDVTIDDNVIIAQLTPNLVLPIDTLQGITIFDGRWDGVRVVNNLIVTNAWHGIIFNRVMNGSIVNNTIAPTNPGRNTRIMVNGDKKDPPETSYNVVVRNNVVPGGRTANIRLPQGVVMDHNLPLDGADDYQDAFVKFDPEHFAYDLHPSKHSDVIGEGTPDGAPTTDIEGLVRKPPFDIGAYAYQRN
jgi:hypothetical protein